MELIEIDSNPAPPDGRVDEILTADGMLLRSAYWPALVSDPTGTVLILHGRTEFIEKYFETIADLRKRGFAVVTFDWRGQGGSQREVPGRCHVESYADYDRDLDAVMRQVVLPDCPQPHFLLAHSMGALAGLRAARDGRVRFSRMVLSAPMLELSRITSPPMGVVRAFAGLALLFGRDTQQLGNRSIRARYTAPIEDARQQRNADVLKSAPALETGLPTVRWVYSALRAMREVESPQFASAIKQPILLVAGGRDRIVSNDAIQQFAVDVRFGAQVIIAGARHEILMEPDELREQFWAAFDAFVPGGDPYEIASGSIQKA